jgi:hypothetical protein
MDPAPSAEGGGRQGALCSSPPDDVTKSILRGSHVAEVRAGLWQAAPAPQQHPGLPACAGSRGAPPCRPRRTRRALARRLREPPPPAARLQAAMTSFFEGQRLVLRSRPDTLYFKEQEQEQLQQVQELMPKYQVRPWAPPANAPAHTSGRRAQGALLEHASLTRTACPACQAVREGAPVTGAAPPPPVRMPQVRPSALLRTARAAALVAGALAAAAPRSVSMAVAGEAGAACREGGSSAALL